ncbi:LysR family substrate-binding domain-containing protein [Streptomyces sp. A7024]|uniref:LysR family substrate-binding domain-containing protein n=1 Tax=Streptomyces coryli TaxID=1128680 RepID=A0A6G4UE80_9ACTN|nr:LysR family substrate-binding domain-containing protein [Streptomyces coryli]
MTGTDDPQVFRLGYVPGVTPGKWVGVWNERLRDVPLELVPVPPGEAAALLRSGGADAGLLRLPVDRTELNAIPLYTETTVVIVPKDHLVTAAEEVTLADLADEVTLHPLDDCLDWDGPPGEAAFERPGTTADAVELVAAGIGLLVVPQSLARLHHRKDLTYRPVTDAPQSQVALSWPGVGEEAPDLVEEFIGIVRGRTVNSTRGRRGQEATAEKERPTAKAKAKAKAGNERGRKAAPGGAAGGGGRRTGAGGPKSGGRRGGKPRRR